MRGRLTCCPASKTTAAKSRYNACSGSGIDRGKHELFRGDLIQPLREAVAFLSSTLYKMRRAPGTSLPYCRMVGSTPTILQ